jgi:hypothetical protein
MDMRGFDPPQYDFLAFPGRSRPRSSAMRTRGARDTDE